MKSRLAMGTSHEAVLLGRSFSINAFYIHNHIAISVLSYVLLLSHHQFRNISVFCIEEDIRLLSKTEFGLRSRGTS